jgi:hypothetical protein
MNYLINLLTDLFTQKYSLMQKIESPNSMVEYFEDLHNAEQAIENHIEQLKDERLKNKLQEIVIGDFKDLKYDNFYDLKKDIDLGDVGIYPTEVYSDTILRLLGTKKQKIIDFLAKGFIPTVYMIFLIIITFYSKKYLLLIGLTFPIIVAYSTKTKFLFFGIIGLLVSIIYIIMNIVKSDLGYLPIWIGFPLLQLSFFLARLNFYKILFKYSSESEKLFTVFYFLGLIEVKRNRFVNH